MHTFTVTWSTDDNIIRLHLVSGATLEDALGIFLYRMAIAHDTTYHIYSIAQH